MSTRSNYYHKPTRVFQEIADAQRQIENKKEKIGDWGEGWALVTPLFAIFSWIFLAGAFWLSGSSAEGVTYYLLLTIFICSILLAIVVIVLMIWGSVGVKQNKIAKKILTTEKLQESSAELLYDYKQSDERIKKLIKKKLSIQDDHITYMATLVNEGYEGSVKDLVTIVKKL